MQSNSSYFSQVSKGISAALLWSLFIIGVLYTPYWIPKSSAPTLYVGTWADLIDPYILDIFYKKYGIKVVLNYFEDNYELVQKIILTKAEGYDLIIPSDFALKSLIDAHLLKPLEKNKFLHWERLHQRTLSTYADPDNSYSIPYHWAIYGLGVNPSMFKKPPLNNWSIIFDKQSDYKVTMIGSARETILIALNYYNWLSILCESDLDALKNYLLEQKQWVEAYTEFRTDALLLSGTIGAGVITTPAFLRLLQSAPHLSFISPQQGLFQMIDSWAIPKKSNRENEVYLLLNFLYESSIIKHHFYKYTFFPATQELHTLLNATPQGKIMNDIHLQTLLPIYFFENTIQQHLLNDIWIDIKGS